MTNPSAYKTANCSSMACTDKIGVLHFQPRPTNTVSVEFPLMQDFCLPFLATVREKLVLTVLQLNQDNVVFLVEAERTNTCVCALILVVSPFAGD